MSLLIHVGKSNKNCSKTFLAIFAIKIKPRHSIKIGNSYSALHAETATKTSHSVHFSSKLAAFLFIEHTVKFQK